MIYQTYMEKHGDRNRGVMMEETVVRSAEGEGVSQFVGQKYLAIESYRKNGEAVRTPVWFVENDGTLLVRTDSDTGKAKRIRRNPRVRIAPCTIRGEPKGAWTSAEARFAGKEEAEKAYQLLREKYGLQYRLVRLIGKFRRGPSKAVCLSINI